MTTYRLSIEEVAFALAAAGGADAAAGFLGTLLGERTAEDINARLMAAAHSLAARGLLARVNGGDDMALDAELQAAAATMAAGDDALRVTVTGDGSERIVTFFLWPDGAVRHELAFGGVSELTLLDAGARAGAVADVTAAAGPTDAGGAPVGRVAVAQLHAARSAAADADAVAAELADLPAGAAGSVAATMADPAAVWTTTLRIVTGEAGKAEANRGFFGVAAGATGWLFDMTDDPMAATVYPLSRASATAAATRLLAAT